MTSPLSPSSPSSLKAHLESPSKRKSRRKFDFPIETLQEYSHYRQDDAARLLGVAPITLKRNCQRLQYRWPYRSIKAKLRREALFAQRRKASDASIGQYLTTSASSQAAPELLLSLGKKDACALTSAIPLTPTVRSLTANFMAASDAVRPKGQRSQLPPLTFLLQKHRVEVQRYQLPRLYRGVRYDRL